MVYVRDFEIKKFFSKFLNFLGFFTKFWPKIQKILETLFFNGFKKFQKVLSEWVKAYKKSLINFFVKPNLEGKFFNLKSSKIGSLWGPPEQPKIELDQKFLQIPWKQGWIEAFIKGKWNFGVTGSRDWKVNPLLLCFCSKFRSKFHPLIQWRPTYIFSPICHKFNIIWDSISFRLYLGR